MEYPRPTPVPTTISAAMSTRHAEDMPTRSALMMDTDACGTSTLRKMTGPLAPAILAARTSTPGTMRIPPATSTVMTMDDTANMMKTADSSPSPNSRMAMGSHARPGIIWNTATGTMPTA